MKENAGTKPTARQTGGVSKPETKSFTKEKLNQLMRARVERSHQSFFKRYGVKDLSELDALVGKSRSYDPLNEIHGKLEKELDELKRTHGDLNEKYMFTTSNINPEKYDDIRTYFKGKNLEISQDSLKAELASHPDWLNKVNTFQSIGTSSNEANMTDERALASKFLGVDL